MDKFWLNLVIIGFIILAIVIGWDIFTTFSGFKHDREYTITEISSNLYGNTEEHLRLDADFGEFEQAAAAENN